MNPNQMSWIEHLGLLMFIALNLLSFQDFLKMFRSSLVKFLNLLWTLHPTQAFFLCCRFIYKIQREDRIIAIHDLKGRLTSWTISLSIVRKLNNRKTQVPIDKILANCCSQQSSKSTVDNLRPTIGLGMIWGTVHEFSIKPLPKCPPKETEKFSVSVRHNVVGNSM